MAVSHGILPRYLESKQNTIAHLTIKLLLSRTLAGCEVVRGPPMKCEKLIADHNEELPARALAFCIKVNFE
jgi:hypothetical protein